MNDTILNDTEGILEIEQILNITNRENVCIDLEDPVFSKLLQHISTQQSTDESYATIHLSSLTVYDPDSYTYNEDSNNNGSIPFITHSSVTTSLRAYPFKAPVNEIISSNYIGDQVISFQISVAVCSNNTIVIHYIETDVVSLCPHLQLSSNNNSTPYPSELKKYMSEQIRVISWLPHPDKSIVNVCFNAHSQTESLKPSALLHLHKYQTIINQSNTMSQTDSVEQLGLASLTNKEETKTSSKSFNKSKLKSSSSSSQLNIPPWLLSASSCVTMDGTTTLPTSLSHHTHDPLPLYSGHVLLVSTMDCGVSALPLQWILLGGELTGTNNTHYKFKYTEHDINDGSTCDVDSEVASADDTLSNSSNHSHVKPASISRNSRSSVFSRNSRLSITDQSSQKSYSKSSNSSYLGYDGFGSSDILEWFTNGKPLNQDEINPNSDPTSNSLSDVYSSFSLLHPWYALDDPLSPMYIHPLQPCLLQSGTIDTLFTNIIIADNIDKNNIHFNKLLAVVVSHLHPQSNTNTSPTPSGLGAGVSSLFSLPTSPSSPSLLPSALITRLACSLNKYYTTNYKLNEHLYSAYHHIDLCDTGYLDVFDYISQNNSFKLLMDVENTSIYRSVAARVTAIRHTINSHSNNPHKDMLSMSMNHIGVVEGDVYVVSVVWWHTRTNEHYVITAYSDNTLSLTNIGNLYSYSLSIPSSIATSSRSSSSDSQSTEQVDLNNRVIDIELIHASSGVSCERCMLEYRILSGGSVNSSAIEGENDLLTVITTNQHIHDNYVPSDRSGHNAPSSVSLDIYDLTSQSQMDIDTSPTSLLINPSSLPPQSIFSPVYQATNTLSSLASPHLPLNITCVDCLKLSQQHQANTDILVKYSNGSPILITLEKKVIFDTVNTTKTNNTDMSEDDSDDWLDYLNEDVLLRALSLLDINNNNHETINYHDSYPKKEILFNHENDYYSLYSDSDSSNSSPSDNWLSTNNIKTILAKEPSLLLNLYVLQSLYKITTTFPQDPSILISSNPIFIQCERTLSMVEEIMSYFKKTNNQVLKNKSPNISEILSIFKSHAPTSNSPLKYFPSLAKYLKPITKKLKRRMNMLKSQCLEHFKNTTMLKVWSRMYMTIPCDTVPHTGFHHLTMLVDDAASTDDPHQISQKPNTNESSSSSSETGESTDINISVNTSPLASFIHMHEAVLCLPLDYHQRKQFYDSFIFSSHIKVTPDLGGVSVLGTSPTINSAKSSVMTDESGPIGETPDKNNSYLDDSDSLSPDQDLLNRNYSDDQFNSRLANLSLDTTHPHFQTSSHPLVHLDMLLDANIVEYQHNHRHENTDVDGSSNTQPLSNQHQTPSNTMSLSKHDKPVLSLPFTLETLFLWLNSVTNPQYSTILASPSLISQIKKNVNLGKIEQALMNSSSSSHTTSNHTTSGKSPFNKQKYELDCLLLKTKEVELASTPKHHFNYYDTITNSLSSFTPQTPLPLPHSLSTTTKLLLASSSSIITATSSQSILPKALKPPVMMSFDGVVIDFHVKHAAYLLLLHQIKLELAISIQKWSNICRRAIIKTSEITMVWKRDIDEVIKTQNMVEKEHFPNPLNTSTITSTPSKTPIQIGQQVATICLLSMLYKYLQSSHNRLYHTTHLFVDELLFTPQYIDFTQHVNTIHIITININSHAPHTLNNTFEQITKKLKNSMPFKLVNFTVIKPASMILASSSMLLSSSIELSQRLLAPLQKKLKMEKYDIGHNSNNSSPGNNDLYTSDNKNILPIFHGFYKSVLKENNISVKSDSKYISSVGSGSLNSPSNTDSYEDVGNDSAISDMDDSDLSLEPNDSNNTGNLSVFKEAIIHYNTISLRDYFGQSILYSTTTYTHTTNSDTKLILSRLSLCSQTPITFTILTEPKPWGMYVFPASTDLYNITNPVILNQNIVQATKESIINNNSSNTDEYMINSLSGNNYHPSEDSLFSFDVDDLDLAHSVSVDNEWNVGYTGGINSTNLTSPNYTKTQTTVSPLTPSKKHLTKINTNLSVVSPLSHSEIDPDSHTNANTITSMSQLSSILSITSSTDRTLYMLRNQNQNIIFYTHLIDMLCAVPALVIDVHQSIINTMSGVDSDQGGTSGNSYTSLVAEFKSILHVFVKKMDVYLIADVVFINTNTNSQTNSHSHSSSLPSIKSQQFSGIFLFKSQVVNNTPVLTPISRLAHTTYKIHNNNREGGVAVGSVGSSVPDGMIMSYQSRRQIITIDMNPLPLSSNKTITQNDVGSSKPLSSPLSSDKVVNSRPSDPSETSATLNLHMSDLDSEKKHPHDSQHSHYLELINSICNKHASHSTFSIGSKHSVGYILHSYSPQDPENEHNQPLSPSMSVPLYDSALLDAKQTLEDHYSSHHNVNVFEYHHQWYYSPLFAYIAQNDAIGKKKYKISQLLILLKNTPEKSHVIKLVKSALLNTLHKYSLDYSLNYNLHVSSLLSSTTSWSNLIQSNLSTLLSYVHAHITHTLHSNTDNQTLVQAHSDSRVDVQHVIHALCNNFLHSYSVEEVFNTHSESVAFSSNVWVRFSTLISGLRSIILLTGTIANSKFQNNLDHLRKRLLDNVYCCVDLISEVNHSFYHLHLLLMMAFAKLHSIYHLHYSSSHFDSISHLATDDDVQSPQTDRFILRSIIATLIHFIITLTPDAKNTTNINTNSSDSSSNLFTHYIPHQHESHYLYSKYLVLCACRDDSNSSFYSEMNSRGLVSSHVDISPLTTFVQNNRCMGVSWIMWFYQHYYILNHSNSSHMMSVLDPHTPFVDYDNSIIPQHQHRLQHQHELEAQLSSVLVYLREYWSNLFTLQSASRIALRTLTQDPLQHQLFNSLLGATVASTSAISSIIEHTLNPSLNTHLSISPHLPVEPQSSEPDRVDSTISPSNNETKWVEVVDVINGIVNTCINTTLLMLLYEQLTPALYNNTTLTHPNCHQVQSTMSENMSVKNGQSVFFLSSLQYYNYLYNTATQSNDCGVSDNHMIGLNPSVKQSSVFSFKYWSKLLIMMISDPVKQLYSTSNPHSHSPSDSHQVSAKTKIMYDKMVSYDHSVAGPIPPHPAHPPLDLTQDTSDLLKLVSINLNSPNSLTILAHNPIHNIIEVFMLSYILNETLYRNAIVGMDWSATLESDSNSSSSLHDDGYNDDELYLIINDSDLNDVNDNYPTKTTSHTSSDIGKNLITSSNSKNDRLSKNVTSSEIEDTKNINTLPIGDSSCILCADKNIYITPINGYKSRFNALLHHSHHPVLEDHEGSASTPEHKPNKNTLNNDDCNHIDNILFEKRYLDKYNLEYNDYISRIEPDDSTSHSPSNHPDHCMTDNLSIITQLNSLLYYYQLQHQPEVAHDVKKTDNLSDMDESETDESETRLTKYQMEYAHHKHNSDLFNMIYRYIDVKYLTSLTNIGGADFLGVTDDYLDLITQLDSIFLTNPDSNSNNNPQNVGILNIFNVDNGLANTIHLLKAVITREITGASGLDVDEYVYDQQVKQHLLQSPVVVSTSDPSITDSTIFSYYSQPDNDSDFTYDEDDDVVFLEITQDHHSDPSDVPDDHCSSKIFSSIPYDLSVSSSQLNNLFAVIDQIVIFLNTLSTTSHVEGPTNRTTNPNTQRIITHLCIQLSHLLMVVYKLLTASFSIPLTHDLLKQLNVKSNIFQKLSVKNIAQYLNIKFNPTYTSEFKSTSSSHTLTIFNHVDACLNALQAILPVSHSSVSKSKHMYSLSEPHSHQHSLPPSEKPYSIQSNDPFVTLHAIQCIVNTYYDSSPNCTPDSADSPSRLNPSTSLHPISSIKPVMFDDLSYNTNYYQHNQSNNFDNTNNSDILPKIPSPHGEIGTSSPWRRLLDLKSSSNSCNYNHYSKSETNLAIQTLVHNYMSQFK